MQIFVMRYYTNLLFVLLVPLLCEGTSVHLKMPPSIALSSKTLRITCGFTTGKELSMMTLLHGSSETTADISTESVYKIRPNKRIILEVDSDTTVKRGSLTFVFHWISCTDFTWYVCRGRDLTYNTVDSENKTLQVLPEIESVTKLSASEIIAKERTTFMCRGTIGKEGSYSVQWYRRTITPLNQLGMGKAGVIGENQCSRSVSSTLTYLVSETDEAKLVLWCQIKNGQTINKMGEFNVKGALPGLTVQLIMPSSIAFDSKEMRVTCRFTSDLLDKMTLLYGNNQITASFEIFEDTYVILPNDRITLEVGPGTTRYSGFITFVFSSITCHDFTWYMCRAEEYFKRLNSEIKTLQAFPKVDDILIQSTITPAVNQSTTFICTGKIEKKSPFTVQWYRTTIIPSNRLIEDETKVIGEDQCSRRVSSSLTYDVSETDGAELILWCRIESKGTVDRKRSFDIRGAGCDLKDSRILVLVVSLIACTSHLI